ncbi:alpha/beta hydrolase [Chachezhania sediminis]|uniref:alpha/beta hydrolase n=1 Tax=Chachezhania sediminis TaxID=2599291 RepID=UPI00131C293C|nr:hypothetical protein [Chachezhania sediminis]
MIETFEYHQAPTERGPLPLEVDLFRTGAPQPRGTVVWLHSGGFRSGSRKSPKHAGIAAELNSQGYDALFPSYRLGRDKPVCGIKWRRIHRMDAEVAALGEGLTVHFTRRLAMAAVEDTVALLYWLRDRPDLHGIAGPVCLCGSSAGGITALNVLYASDLAQVRRPDNISSVFVASGAFAYATSRVTGEVPVLALHNPADTRVPIAPIRRLAAHDPARIRLIETTIEHGGIRAHPAEPLAEAVARILHHDRTARNLDL